MTSSASAPAGLVADLVAREDYARAVGLLQVQLRARPRDVELRQQLADVLVMAGRGGEAAPLLQELAEDLALAGRAAPAIAAAKRARALDPAQGGEERLAALIDGAGAPATTSPEVTELPLSDAAVREQLVGLIDDALRGARPDPGGTRSEEVRSPLFEDFARDELVEVIRGLRLLTFDAGDIVVSEGEPGHSLFVLTKGRVRAFVRQASGHSARVRDLQEGDFFGEISLLQGGRRTATITCATRCELLELDRATLDAIAARHPGVLEVMRTFHDQRAGSTVEHMIRGLGTA